MGIKRTAWSRQIDLGMQNQSFLSILQHKMQKTKLPYFPLYFWADSFENLKCPATAHFLTENSEIFSSSLFFITTGLVDLPWWNSTKLQIRNTLMYIYYILYTFSVLKKEIDLQELLYSIQSLLNFVFFRIFRLLN